MFFKTATDRHSWQQTNALKQLKNDIGFVGLVRRTASKLFKVKNRELDPATPCVRGWPWYHTWWWVKGIWSVSTHEHDTQGPSWGYSVLCQFWLFLIYWLSHACVMTEIMSRAKLHVYLLRKKEISKSFMLHQLPRCCGEDGGWMPLPTRPQRYFDPASLVAAFRKSRRCYRSSCCCCCFYINIAVLIIANRRTEAEIWIVPLRSRRENRASYGTWSHPLSSKLQASKNFIV